MTEQGKAPAARVTGGHCTTCGRPWDDCHAEMERLQVENERLRKGLLGAETLEAIAEETTAATLRAKTEMVCTCASLRAKGFSAGCSRCSDA